MCVTDAQGTMHSYRPLYLIIYTKKPITVYCTKANETNKKATCIQGTIINKTRNKDADLISP